MKKLFFYMVAAAITLTSCSSEDVVEVNNGNAIDFRVAMGPGANSRGLETTKANINQMFVTAILTESGENYFQNELYTLSGDVFTTESKVIWYWPLQALDFYAYSYGVANPKVKDFVLTTTDGEDNSEAMSAKRVSLFGNVTIDNTTCQFAGFTPNSEISKQIDFVTAYSQGNRSGNMDNGVDLTFNHALSQIRIRAYNNNANYTYEICGVKIANVVSKDDFTKSDDGDYWSNSTSTFSKVFDSENQEAINCGSYTVMYEATPITLNQEEGVTDEFGYNGVDILDLKTNGAAMLIPQTLTGWNHLQSATDKGSYLAVLVNIKARKTGAQVYPSKSKGTYAWAVVPITGEWKMGNKYIYILDFTTGAGYDEETGDRILEGEVQLKTLVKPWLPEDDADAEIQTPME